ncbi:unnamed protein product [Durusdinium trenchii]|uniref:Uncharacterized protein n=2 Tax=Durusdinium trenchii TaxID=1381693 RepID=A0ABP0IJX8_9DINO
MEPTEPPDAAEPPPEPAEPDEHTDPESRSDSEQRGSRAECRSPSRRPAVKRRPGPPKRVKVETKQETTSPTASASVKCEILEVSDVEAQPAPKAARPKTLPKRKQEPAKAPSAGGGRMLISAIAASMKPKPKKLLTVKKEKKSTAPTPASLKRMKENALAQTRAQEAKLQWRRAAAAAATQKKRTWEGLSKAPKQGERPAEASSAPAAGGGAKAVVKWHAGPSVPAAFQHGGWPQKHQQEKPQHETASWQVKWTEKEPWKHSTHSWSSRSWASRDARPALPAPARQLEQMKEILQLVAGQLTNKWSYQSRELKEVEVGDLRFSSDTVTSTFSDGWSIYDLEKDVNNSRKCAGLDWYDRDSWILQKLEPLVAVRHKGATVVVKGHRRLKAAVILKQQLRAKLYVRCRVFSLDDEAEETPATVLALYALNPQANLDVLIKGI